MPDPGDDADVYCDVHTTDERPMSTDVHTKAHTNLPMHRRHSHATDVHTETSHRDPRVIDDHTPIRTVPPHLHIDVPTDQSLNLQTSLHPPLTRSQVHGPHRPLPPSDVDILHGLLPPLGPSEVTPSLAEGARRRKFAGGRGRRHRGILSGSYTGTPWYSVGRPETSGLYAGSQGLRDACVGPRLSIRNVSLRHVPTTSQTSLTHRQTSTAPGTPHLGTSRTETRNLRRGTPGYTPFSPSDQTHKISQGIRGWYHA